MIKLFEAFANIDDVKSEIFVKAIETYELGIIKFFIKKGYDISGKNALINASYDDNILRYFLKNGSDVKALEDHNQLHNIEVQKALIDFGHDIFIYQTVGFNKQLKFDPKYADTVQNFENMEKFNL